MSEGNLTEQIKAELGRIDERVQDFIKGHKAQIEEGAALAKTAKATADDLLTKQGELRERLQDVEQKQAKRDRSGGEGEMADAGQMVRAAIEASTELAAILARPQLGKSVSIDITRSALDMSIRATLTNTGTTGGALNYPGMVLPLVEPLLRKLHVRDLIAPGRTSQAAIFYPKETGYTNNAAPVSEGTLKPESDITIDSVTEAVRTIAHWLRVSTQMLNDIPALQSYINRRLIYGLKYVEDVELLTGSGTGQHLEGIYTQATAYAQPSGVQIVAATETDLDKLRLALLQVELADANATGIVLHPTDWANIELLKDGENRYLFVNPQNTTTGRLWGRDVVSSKAMTQGRFLVGDFATHAQIFDREDANVAISFEDRDNFVRNLATIRVEERLALAVYRPEAFVKGVLESAS